MKRGIALLLAGIAAGLLGGMAEAEAYPYFQFSSGTETCNQCHYAPAGGGLISEWGRMESADTLSRGGDGEFLHGALSLPQWLDLGGDLRLAALINDTGSDEGAEFAAFPMQADVAMRVKLGALSAVGNLGLKGAAREADLQAGSARQEAGLAGYVMSREHYLQWQKKATAPYLRAGRFYAPFGLRLPDHTTYVRRYTGFNLLEETYGLSGGWVKGRRELHVTLFASDPLRWAPRREYGATAMGEWRTTNSAYGLSSRAAFGDTEQRATAGVFYKRWLPGAKLFWLSEVDTSWQRFPDAKGASRWQVAAYAGPVWNPVQGVYASVAYELFDQDLAVSKVERHAASMWVSILPRAHFEIMLAGRAQVIGDADKALMTMLQLHYYP